MLNLESHIVLNPIEIWQPRHHDDVCLIAKKKVKEHNKIWFSYKDKESKRGPLTGKEFYISKQRVKKWPVESNGSIPCYAVPMGELQEFKQERSW